jgi:hypothetical protein
MNGTSRPEGGPSRAIPTVPDPDNALAVATEDMLAADERACELIVWCEALTDAGLAETARRSRVVARDVLDLADALAAERSAREALQDRCERLQAIIGKKAYEIAGKTAAYEATRGR